MQVARAITQKKFLSGAWAIQYLQGDYRHGAYYIHQVSVGEDRQGRLLIERHRGFGSKLTDSWPKWKVFRGTVCGCDGFCGLWLPYLDTLLAECILVKLDKADRVLSLLV